METFRELLELSQQTRKGLTFYVGGQTIPGYVIRILDAGGAVEVGNQTQSRVVIRLERVDAVGTV
jgi:hypothetical protein